MPVKVKVNINPNAIINNHNLQEGGKAQLTFANEVLAKANPYTPRDHGVLSDATIQDSGKQILYSTPYARYQYYGKVMAGSPKKPIDKDLTYNGAPMRGKEWIKRMWADRKDDIVNAVANVTGGKAK